MSTRKNRNEKVAVGMKQSECIRSYCGKAVIHFRGRALKAPEVVALYEEHIALLKQADEARSKWLRLVQEADAKGVVVDALSKVCASYVANAFGEGSDAYRAFGLADGKRRKPSPETLVVAAEKRRATRKARGTMGMKQREAIHGSVDAGAQHAGAAPPAGAPVAPVTTSTIGVGAPPVSNGAGVVNGASH